MIGVPAVKFACFEPRSLRFVSASPGTGASLRAA